MSEAPQDVQAIARSLTGAAEPVVEPARRGGNNRLYQVTVRDGRFALKLYLRDASDPRDRLGTEFAALDFLSRHGVACVPCPIARDDAAGAALYTWIDGDPIATVTDGAIDAAADFVDQLHALRTVEEAKTFPLASEACLSGLDVLSQIDGRFQKLRTVAHDDRPLADFLGGDFAPALALFEERARDGYDFEVPLAAERVTLSPSDFGFHNALDRNGRLVFLDFEYFGRDDPVKLCADFLLHPGFTCSPSAKARFLRRVRVTYGRDGGFENRLSCLYPLIGLRWCMILLNEFLPERWRRRAYAGAEDRAAAQARQLDAARRLLASLVDSGGRPLHD